MKKPTPPPQPWQIEDAARLLRLWESKKEKISQEAFGAKYNIGSQGMVWQYLNGHRPLNIAAAQAFADGLGVSIESFSPRIAAQIKKAGLFATADSAQAPNIGAASATLSYADRPLDELPDTAKTAGTATSGETQDLIDRLTDLDKKGLIFEGVLDHISAFLTLALSLKEVQDSENKKDEAPGPDMKAHIERMRRLKAGDKDVGGSKRSKGTKY